MSQDIDFATVMSAKELLTLRKKIELTQLEMTTHMGLSKSAYVAVETGTATMRKIHQIAAERAAISAIAYRPELAAGLLDTKKAFFLVDVRNASDAPKAAGMK